MSKNNYHTPQGWGYGDTGQPGYGKPFQRPFSHPETQQPAFGEPYNPYAVQGTGSNLAEKPRGKQPSKRQQQRRTGRNFAFGYALIIWAVHLISFISPIPLQYFGIHPREPQGLLFIFTSPLLHANFEHLISNTLPGMLFAYLIGYSGKRVFWEVTMFVVVIGGVGTWLFGGVGTNHIGASGLVYGWLAYLVVRGFFNRSGKQIGLGILLAFLYSGLIWGVLPGTPGMSWQAHLFGAIGGIVAGMMITSDDPPELTAKREAKKADKIARKQGF